MCCTYSDGEPWKKVKILKVKPGDVPLEQLYHTPLVLKPVKDHDLKKVARDYIPPPSATFIWKCPIKMRMERKQNTKTMTSCGNSLHLSGH